VNQKELTAPIERISLMSLMTELMVALHKVFWPFLEQQKFKAIRPLKQQDERNWILCPSYRVKRKVCIHTVDVQYDRFREYFCVNMGVHFRFLPLTFNEELPTPHKTQTSMCMFNHRLSPDGGDHWWEVTNARDATLESVRDVIRVFDETGLAFFETYGVLPGPYESITIAGLDSGEYQKFIPRTDLRLSPSMIASVMAYISKYLGNDEASKEFEQYALSRIHERFQHRTEKYLRFLDDPTRTE